MDTCFIDYDDSLIGRIPYVDAYNFYGTEAGGANEKKALDCIRYAIEKILEWSRGEVTNLETRGISCLCSIREGYA